MNFAARHPSGIGEAVTRRRREDRYPVLTFLVKTWNILGSIAAFAAFLFLALGFEFQTPASWIRRIEIVEGRRDSLMNQRVRTLEQSTGDIVRVLRIVGRDVCGRFTDEQLRVTPDCDSLYFPVRPQPSRRRTP